MIASLRKQYAAKGIQFTWAAFFIGAVVYHFFICVSVWIVHKRCAHQKEGLLKLRRFPARGGNVNFPAANIS